MQKPLSVIKEGTKGIQYSLKNVASGIMEIVNSAMFPARSWRAALQVVTVDIYMSRSCTVSDFILVQSLSMDLYNDLDFFLEECAASITSCIMFLLSRAITHQLQ